MAKRLQEGEQRIIEQIPQLTVLSANFEGLGALTAERDAPDIVDLFTELMQALDNYAGQYAMETLKMSGQRYMAVCGLSVLRLDHDKRTVDFALSALTTLHQFNYKHGTALSLRIGVHSGSAIAGLMGIDTQSPTYDVWGESVNIAGYLNEVASLNTIVVSKDVHDRLSDLYPFRPSTSIELGDATRIETWVLEEPGRAS
ncbi:adenylate/guanylate cyclase domain-containing protein [Candidatus Entotheonella palauensis]|uniref:adenylate/guanylate cyclase domain-containing protein n=1 Tax=Candidatus Entotheonella palauensis TaxID=93172 RepID=UPI0015C4217A|nr:adenylate/guanylate cyclase domain-containing protein [Candidatus Entotheonella palauensis]